MPFHPQAPDRSYSGFSVRKAWLAGIITIILLLTAIVGIGRIGNYEALSLLEAMLSSIQFLCSSIITAASTILALMLTLLSFTSQMKERWRPEYYNRIELITRLAVITFIGAVFLLLLLTLPVVEPQGKLFYWLRVLYYFILGYTSVLGGLMITLIVLLFGAAHNVIVLLHPSRDSTHLLYEDEEDEDNLSESSSSED